MVKLKKPLTIQDIKEVRGANFNAGGSVNLIQCSYCRNLCEEETIIKTKSNKYACEVCYDPADPEQRSEELELPDETTGAEQVQGKTLEKTPPGSFINADAKIIEKTREINTDDLNKDIKIPSELNIIDCPPDVNSDPDYFRKLFKNFWRLFNNDSDWVFIIHDRGTGKSKQVAIYTLYQIAKYYDYEGSFIMRNWDEPTRQSKEYFKKIIREFDEVMWIGERTTAKKSQWGLMWLSTYKGISYKKNVSDKAGELRCHFLDLFSPEQARTLINKPVRTVFFDECIPTRNQIKQGKGWKLDESSKYMEALESLARLTVPKKIFTGNPNDSFYNCWMLIEHFKEELTALSKWYWKNRPNNPDKWLAWAWTKELKKGNKTLQLKKVARRKKDFTTYEDDNWDIFFEKMEDLKIVDHKNGATPQYVFNNCICYVSKENYFYFIDARSKDISSRDRTIIKELPEYCVNDEQRLRSKQLVKWERMGEDCSKYRKNLLRLYEVNQLFFADMNAKMLIESFMGKHKIID